jgi:tetratricopeptide (TPR) repeat protein
MLITCPECRSKLRVPDGVADWTRECPRCGASLCPQSGGAPSLQAVAAAGPPKVFISYSRKDHEFARLLAASLILQGIQVWKDDCQIRTGERFDTRIFSAIDVSDVFLVLLSPAAQTSEWVPRELQHALQRSQQVGAPRVMPCLIAECQLPDSVRDLNFADFRQSFESPLAKVVADINERCSDQPPYQPECGASPPYRETAQNEAIIHYNRGIDAYRHGQVAEALAFFEEAHRLDPSHFDAIYNSAVVAYDLAMRLSGAGLYRLVVNRYEEVLRLRPDDVDAMVNLVLQRKVDVA